MQKKRFLIVFLVALISLILNSSTFVLADLPGGCCITAGQTCDQVSSATMCTGTYQTYSDTDCSEVESCKFGCCCNNGITGDQGMYKEQCIGFVSDPTQFKPLFSYDITKKLDYDSLEAAGQSPCSSPSGICQSTLPACEKKVCESGVPSSCWCGSKQANTNEFCCLDDNLVFSSQNDCYTNSQNCKLVQLSYFNVSGTIFKEQAKVPAGTGTEFVQAGGAKVFLEGRQTTTLNDGTYTFSNVPSGTRTITAYLDSDHQQGIKTVQIVNQDLSGVNINLYLWGITDRDSDGYHSGIDPCDIEAKIPFPQSNKFNYETGYCSDDIDNDCDGTKDCLDIDCLSSSACAAAATCGDLICNTSVSPSECNSCPSDCNPQQCCGDNRVQPALGESCDGTATNTCYLGCNTTSCRCFPSQCAGMQCEQDADCISSFGAGYQCISCVCYDTSVPSECGDGQVTGFEHCDVGSDGISGTGDDMDMIDDLPPLLSELYGGPHGGARFDCLSACGSMGTPSECQCLIQHECGDGVITSPFEECDIGGGAPDTCVGDGFCLLDMCMCDYPCRGEPDTMPPESLKVETVEGELSAELTWNLNSICSVGRFDVYRCEVDQTAQSSDLIVTNPASSLCEPREGQFLGETEGYTFTDEELEYEKMYCYAVEAVYSNYNINELTEFVPETHCIMTGSEECFKYKDEFCYENKIYSCGEDNFFDILNPVEDCSAKPEGDYLCVGPDELGNAECYYQSICEQCNGILGLYANIGKADYIDPYVGPPAIKTPCTQIPTCYPDYTTTSINKYFPCENVSSCYDYISEGSCMEDRCVVNNCTWESHPKYGFMGIGVCRTTVEEDQECYKCNDNLYVDNFNQLYGRCDREMCKLYGDCYYTLTEYQDQPGSCIHKNDMSCREYASKEDCVMNSSTEREVDVNTQWQFYNFTLGRYVQTDLCNINNRLINCSKISGTNAITQRSNDYFGFGVCEWDETKGDEGTCIKNADNNRFADCMDNSITCKTDFEPPETYLLPYNATYVGDKPLLGKNIKIKAVVQDNVYSQDNDQEIFTYGCVAKTSCYPTERAIDNWIYMEGPNNTLGDYKLFYFSEDKSRNLEVVKSMDVFLDTAAPAVKVRNSTTNATSPDGEYWFTNLTITLEAKDNFDNYSQCVAFLVSERGIVQEINNIFGLYGTNWSRAYYELEDDIYTYYYFCTDRAGNVAEGQVVFDMEGDSAINSPLPKGTIAYTDVVLSVRTNESATCKYKIDDNNWWDEDEKDPAYYTQMTDVLSDVSNNGRLHSKDHSLPANASAYYIFNVKCQLDSGKIKGNRNDRIRFAVDLTPPSVSVANCINGSQFPTNITYGDDVGICLKCTDNANINDRDFGCKKITYCLGENASERCTIYNYESDGISDMIVLSGSTRLSYTVEDQGGNTAAGFFDLAIDKTFPELNVSLYKSLDISQPEIETFTFGTYYVLIDSSKLLTDIKAVMKIGTLVLPVTMHSYNEGYIRSLWFFDVPYSLNELRGKDGVPAILVINSTDRLNHKSIIEVEYELDTVGPTLPVLEPLFDGQFVADGADYMDYPVFFNKNENKYYTNKPYVFVTGKTQKPPLMIHYFVNDRGRPQKTYNQTINAYQRNASSPQTVLKTGSPKNHTWININDVNSDLITNFFVPGMYLEFSTHSRDNYGFYDVYYRIKNVSAVSSIESKIFLEEPLEEEVRLGDTIFLFNKPYPYNWFGEYIDLGLGDNMFYLVSEDETGNVALADEEFAIFYDPVAPKVVKHVPYAGTTSNNGTDISLIVKELKQAGSMLNLQGFYLDISGAGDATIRYPDPKLNITTYEMGGYVYYNITYHPGVSLNGTYHVKFFVKDYAGNKLDESNEDAEWTFTVDINAPKRPELVIKGGTYYGGTWYAYSSPDFTINFSDVEPINITGLYIDDFDTRKDIICTEPDYNFFDCEFVSPLEADVDIYNDITIITQDEFEIMIVAYKKLSDGSASPFGVYRDYSLVIDNLTPFFNADPVFDDYIRDNVNATFQFNIGHELHDLNATLIYGGQNYPLTQTYHEFNGYWFTWSVPNFEKDVAEHYWTESYNPFKIIVADYAGNSREYEGEIYIDLTKPDLTSLLVDVPEAPLAHETPFGLNYTTRLTDITIVGSFAWDDTEAVYVTPGNYRAATDSYDNWTYAMLQPEDYPQNFTIRLTIKGPPQNVTQNQMQLIIIDKAGYNISRSLWVWKDLKPPAPPLVIYT